MDHGPDDALRPSFGPRMPRAAAASLAQRPIPCSLSEGSECGRDRGPRPSSRRYMRRVASSDFENPRMRGATMNTIRDSVRSEYAGLLPIGPSDEFVRPADLKKDQSPNRHLGKRALRALARFLVTFCMFLAAILAWRSYGNIAKQIAAYVDRQLGWFALTSRTVPNTTAVTASAAPLPDRRQLDEVLPDLHATGQSIDRIAASQQQITRSIDQVATRIAAGPELTHSTDDTASDIALAPAADATRIMVESRADGASLQPIDIKPTDVRSQQTLPEKGKSYCFPSALAVLQHNSGVWPSWTLRAPGHEGTLCWYAAARPRGSDHRPRAIDH
jgi:hypothetical protein